MTRKLNMTTLTTGLLAVAALTMTAAVAREALASGPEAPTPRVVSVTAEEAAPAPDVARASDYAQARVALEAAAHPAIDAALDPAAPAKAPDGIATSPGTAAASGSGSASGSASVPSLDTDPSGFFQDLYAASRSKEWGVVFGLGLLGLVYALRRWVLAELHGWFATAFGGVVVAFALAELSEVGLALAAGAHLTVAMALEQVTTAATAAGLWQWAQKKWPQLGLVIKAKATS